MRQQRIRPTGVEHTFAEDRIIVSKTDTRGLMTYVNQLFVEMSGYEEADLVGRPHNLIRHPDMPRAVFRLLWERVGAGEEIFAYVVNLRADGGHYWVLAHVTPTVGPDGTVVGYHSNRRTASRGALDQVRPLYAALVAEEARHASSPEALAASSALLDDLLARRGTTYDELVWSLDAAAAPTEGAAA
ncbi:PAS domain-containing protein [Nocardioides kribbensis]|uniref:PAS domain-containing protein n=1 Tax=Nocardioides kribbensis TaxID=305517 RepID=UPI00187A11F6|nr:PAS domain-containing protein [Nocardioides kribbensis]